MEKHHKIWSSKPCYLEEISATKRLTTRKHAKMTGGDLCEMCEGNPGPGKTVLLG